MMNALEARKKQLTSPEDVVEELDQWYQTQIRVIADYKYMFEKGTDFLRANKTERLQKFSFSNMPFEHHRKMMDNF